MAVDLTDRRLAPELWATLQNNLGNLCNNRQRPDLATCATDAYSKALTIRTAATMPREHVDTLVNLANLRFNFKQWSTASELYLKAAAVSRAAFDPTLAHDILLFDAARSDRWFERASYALAKIGRISDAIAIADEGRMRVLKQRLSGLSSLSVGSSLIDRLRGLIKGRTVVLMPIITTAGAVLFAISSRGDTLDMQELFLDNVSGDATARFLNSQWLHKYSDVFGSDSISEAAIQTWDAEIVAAGDWIGTLLVEPAIAWLERDGRWPADSIIFVVQGELALLPLHVARLRSGRRLLEMTNVSYLPSLAIWEPGTASTAARRFFSISDPSQDSGLPFASMEASTIVGGTKMEGAVNKTQVLQALGDADILHFAGHARFDVDDPEGSGIRLSGQERLQVRDIQAARPPRAPNLVILSACETGRVETAKMANEFVGLPAAFMSIGAKGVISSLWPASDGPSFFLMVRLISELQDGKRPAPALRDAQLWLANSKGSELAGVLRSLHPKPGTEAAKLEQALRIQYRNSQPYTDPWAWAGFVYSGVVQ